MQYLEGFHLAHSFHDYDWEIICLNSIGVLAFFNLRYDVAILCFYLVYEYRERVSFILFSSEIKKDGFLCCFFFV